MRGVSAGVGLMVSPASVLGSSFPRFPHLRRHLVMFSQSLWNISSRSSDYPVSGKCPMLSWLENVFPGKICSKCGAESSPARLWLPAAGGGRAWAARTGSGPMWMCGDILGCSAAVEGPFADDGTSVLPPSNYRVCEACREGRCGGSVGGVGVLRARRCHLRAGFQQCKSFVEMGTVRCCPL